MNAHDPVPGLADGSAPLGHRLDNFELQGAVVQRPSGVVYRGWDHNLGIPVAIREYLPLDLVWRKADGDVEPLDAGAIDAFERGRQAFVNEARVLARCDHPSLLRVRQLLHAHGTSYRVMPWYDGRPLLDVRHDIEAPPDEAALRALLADLLGALEAYHRVGGVHGGVNPSQILLLDNDRALLLGPGAARRDAAGAAAEALMRPQEAGFLAPEQLAPVEDARTGPWTDFFALARVVRFCISGMLPPAHGEPAPEPAAETVEKLYFDAPGVRYGENFLATLDAAASPAIDERPQTVAEFREWLDHGLHRVAALSAPSAVQLAGALEPARRAVQATGPSAPLESPAPDVPSTPAAPPADAPISGTPVTATPAAAATDAATPARPAATAAVQDAEEPDEETVDLIRRVIESIPARIDPPLRMPPPESAKPPESQESPMPQEALDGAGADWQADRLSDLPPSALPRSRSRHVRSLVVGVVLLALAGYGAWALLQPVSLSAGPPVASALPPGNRVPANTVAEEAVPGPAPAAAPASVAAPATASVAGASAATAPGADDVAAEPRPAVAAAHPATPGSATAALPAPESHVTAAVANAPHAAPPVAERVTRPAAPNSPANPRAACGGRTNFSLYRCMQQQCAMAAWARHPQCVRLKATDSVD